MFSQKSKKIPESFTEKLFHSRLVEFFFKHDGYEIFNKSFLKKHLHIFFDLKLVLGILFASFKSNATTLVT